MFNNMHAKSISFVLALLGLLGPSCGCPDVSSINGAKELRSTSFSSTSLGIVDDDCGDAGADAGAGAASS
jgi:hypothetical protein